jgi:hypothetical protein
LKAAQDEMRVLNCTQQNRKRIMNEPKRITNLERVKIELERGKLQLEQEKIKLERSKAIWTSLSIFIPLLIAAITIAFNSWSQVQQSKSAFTLQAAELVMNTDSPTATYNKARALSALFPDQLPPSFNDFAEEFNPDLYSVETSTARRTLLQWIIDKPQQKQEILDAWIALFPEHEWVNDLR